MKRLPPLKKIPSYPFEEPPTIAEFAHAARMQPSTVYRMRDAGALRVIQMHRGQRVETEWANRYLRKGFTVEEEALWRTYNKLQNDKRRP